MLAGNSAYIPVATGYELLETQVVGSTQQASVEFTNVNTNYGSTYQHLQVRATVKTSGSGQDKLLYMYLNGDTTLTNYRAHILFVYNGAVDSDPWSGPLAGYGVGTTTANSFCANIIDILDPFETTKNTTVRTISGFANGTGTNSLINLQSMVWMNTNAITTIRFQSPNENIIQYSRFSLYGMRSS